MVVQFDDQQAGKRGTPRRGNAVHIKALKNKRRFYTRRCSLQPTALISYLHVTVIARNGAMYNKRIMTTESQPAITKGLPAGAGARASRTGTQSDTPVITQNNDVQTTTGETRWDGTEAPQALPLALPLTEGISSRHYKWRFLHTKKGKPRKACPLRINCLTD